MKAKHKWIDQLDDDMLFDLAESSKILETIPQNVNYKIINSMIKTCEENKNILTVITDFFRYKKLITVMAVILFLFLGYIFYENYFIPLNERGTVSIVKSEGDIKINKNKKSYNPDEIKSLSKGFIISTDKGSEVNLKIGEKSFTNINELSEVKIVKLFKKDDLEENIIYLKKGRVDCEVNLISSRSLFKVETDILTVAVEGTKFSVEVNDKQDVKIEVKEGKVKVNYKFTGLDKKTKINDNVRNSLNDLYNSTRMLVVDNFVLIEKSYIDNINIKIKNIIDKAERNNKLKNINDKLINEINQLKIEIKNNNKDLVSKEEKAEEIIKNKKISNDIETLENSIKIIKLNKNEQYKNIAFVYNWDRNTVLDQKLEIIKNDISNNVEGTKLYSISSKNLSNYLKITGSVLLFFNYNEIKSDKELISFIKVYFNLSNDKMTSLMKNKKTIYLNNEYEGKNIILFAGSDNKILTEFIDSYKLEF